MFEWHKLHGVGQDPVNGIVVGTESCGPKLSDTPVYGDSVM